MTPQNGQLCFSTFTVIREQGGIYKLVQYYLVLGHYKINREDPGPLASGLQALLSITQSIFGLFEPAWEIVGIFFGAWRLLITPVDSWGPTMGLV